MCAVQAQGYMFRNLFLKQWFETKDRMETLIVGDPLDKNTDIGAINSKAQLEVINSYLKIGQQEGAEMFQASGSVPKKDSFAGLRSLPMWHNQTELAQEEIFGPVLTIQSFRTDDEVIEKANNTPFGLSAGVWTDKAPRF